MPIGIASNATGYFQGKFPNFTAANAFLKQEFRQWAIGCLFNAVSCIIKHKTATTNWEISDGSNFEFVVEGSSTRNGTSG
jgi:hypothetical protein